MATTQEIIDRLNRYESEHPDRQEARAGRAYDPWNDVILTLAEYDEGGTNDIDTHASDRFALTDGTVIRFDTMRAEWYEQS